MRIRSKIRGVAVFLLVILLLLLIKGFKPQQDLIWLGALSSAVVFHRFWELLGELKAGRKRQRAAALQNGGALGAR